MQALLIGVVLPGVIKIRSMRKQIKKACPFVKERACPYYNESLSNLLLNNTGDLEYWKIHSDN